MKDARPEAIKAIAEKLLTEKYEGARCMFAAGSMMRGQATATSDIDCVILFDSQFNAPHRDSYFFENWPMEAFVHTPQSLAYYMEGDRVDGYASLAHMITEGIVIGTDAELIASTQAIARAFIDAGPKPLAPDTIERQRYVLTDILDDLADSRPIGEYYGCPAELYLLLGDLYLRGNNAWSGKSKQLIRRLRLHSPHIASAYEQAFDAAYKGNPAEVIALADTLLAPFGGRHWSGYKSNANEAWRNFTKPKAGE